ncbi:hypothetical protein HNQ51_000444 [Inhella inkyongensis]|uniref:Uncharacterized protein n=1 Tax=Inhella inkyongensis TaxID=392593 RepID=A0A840S3A0_9BURK|nr:hypothetical protein [Inhella inkyongensis]
MGYRRKRRTRHLYLAAFLAAVGALSLLAMLMLALASTPN